jgi:lysophospholipid acyltransferase (LPLAT)-like uncharacterized protein
MARSLDTNIRRSRTSLLAGYLSALAMKLWAMTLRFDVNDNPKITQPYIAAPPVIFALWHNRIFTMPPIWAKTGGKFRKTVVLTSASKDGTSLATAMSCFGLGAIRGSSSRRAVSALIGMKKALLCGYDVCVTPDGPKGPRYQVQPGVIKIAQTTGTDIIPIHIRYTAAWRLKTWDQFVIPIPFSRVSVIFDTPQHIPHDLDERGFENARLALEKCLIAGSDD